LSSIISENCFNF